MQTTRSDLPKQKQERMWPPGYHTKRTARLDQKELHGRKALPIHRVCLYLGQTTIRTGDSQRRKRSYNQRR